MKIIIDNLDGPNYTKELFQILILCNGDGNSKIVETSAEHDFRPKRFIGMVCTTEFETVLFV